MKFFKKHKGWLITLAVLAIAVGILVSGVFRKSNDVTANDGSAAVNGTMMQYFEWYLPNDGNHWNKVADNADDLAAAGFTALWLPPAYKGTSSNDVGYGPYDLYDLGEFDQKGTVRTKYGTKDQYLNAINTLHANGIDVYADIVLNHKAGADTTETVNAVQVQYGNRNYQQSGAYDISAWTVFNFPGRGDKYSSFKWNASCFDGVDYDNNQRTNAVFRFSNKYWDWKVDSENANYDYLMYADVDFDSSYVVDELKTWGEWYISMANLDGFRLDAVKHIKYTFFKDWLTTLRQRTGKELFSVGEYWSYELGKLQDYINETGGTTSLFDVPLHNNLYSASYGNGNYDMRYILSNTLVSVDPAHAVTFVVNHDTQPNQSLQSFVADWFKPLAYTLILTRQDGYPCVFYGDYYGLTSGGKSFQNEINSLMKARTQYAYGFQHDYFDDCNIIGWTREGSTSHPNSGLAALITDGAGGSKKMYVGTSHAGEEWYDITGHQSGTVKIDNSGYGVFTVDGGSNSVWVPSGSTAEPETVPEGNNEVTIYYKNSWSNTYAHYQIGSGSWTEVPGVKMEDVTSDYGKITIKMGGYTNVNICFNNGSTKWDNNGGNNYSLKPGTYTIVSGKVVSGVPSSIPVDTPTEAPTEAPTQAPTEAPTQAPTEAPTQAPTQAPTEAPTQAPTTSNGDIVLHYYSTWGGANIYYWNVSNGATTTWPGEAMTSEGDGWYTYTLKNATSANVIFDYNGKQTADLSRTTGEWWYYNNKWYSSNPLANTNTNTVTIYYYKSWSNKYIHYQIGNGTWTTAPGKKMDKYSTYYGKITIDLGSATSMKACFNNGGNTWDNNGGKDYTFTAGTYTVKNGKITSGTP